MMGLFTKEWTPEQADSWTWHDLFACVFGVLAFVLITIGLAGALLLQLWGFVAVALSILCTWVTFKVIDPKLRALSKGFEDKQAGYLDAIERHNRWEG